MGCCSSSPLVKETNIATKINKKQLNILASDKNQNQKLNNDDKIGKNNDNLKINEKQNNEEENVKKSIIKEESKLKNKFDEEKKENSSLKKSKVENEENEKEENKEIEEKENKEPEKEVNKEIEEKENKENEKEVNKEIEEKENEETEKEEYSSSIISKSEGDKGSIIKEENVIKKNNSEKFLSYNNLRISENVIEFLPKDVSKEEIKEMVLNALGDSIANDNLKYIKGKNLTDKQVNAIIEILYKNVKKENAEINYEQIFGDTNIKIGLKEMNKENIKNIIFNNSEPSEEEIKEVLAQYISENNIPKFFVIELM